MQARHLFDYTAKHLSVSFRVINRVAHCFVRFYAAARAARYSIYGNRIALSAWVICQLLSILQWCAWKRRRAERPGLCLTVCACLGDLHEAIVAANGIQIRTYIVILTDESRK